MLEELGCVRVVDLPLWSEGVLGVWMMCEWWVATPFRA